MQPGSVCEVSVELGVVAQRLDPYEAPSLALGSAAHSCRVGAVRGGAGR
jgi:hypothetical protein